MWVSSGQDQWCTEFIQHVGQTFTALNVKPC